MAVKKTPKNFSVQQIFEILMQRPSDNSIIGYLKHCKTTTLENTVEMTYPTGGRGNVYIGRGFSHSKRATFTVESATWNTEVIAAQNGVDVTLGETTYRKYVQVDLVSGADSYNLPSNPVKETGATKYIGVIYATSASGDYLSEVQEDIAVSDGMFTVTVNEEATPAFITLNEGAAAKLIGEGAVKLTMAYTVKSATTAQRIDIKTDTMPDTALVTAYGLVADNCDGTLYPCIIHGTVQIDGNWNWEITADGDPAVQNISMEFVAGCASNDLYSIIIDTDEE